MNALKEFIRMMFGIPEQEPVPTIAVVVVGIFLIFLFTILSVAV